MNCYEALPKETQDLLENNERKRLRGIDYYKLQNLLNEDGCNYRINDWKRHFPEFYKILCKSGYL
jgi:hypothetical protein